MSCEAQRQALNEANAALNDSVTNRTVAQNELAAANDAVEVANANQAAATEAANAAQSAVVEAANNQQAANQALLDCLIGGGTR